MKKESFFKKGLYTGLGLISMTAEGVKKVVKSIGNGIESAGKAIGKGLKTAEDKGRETGEKMKAKAEERKQKVDAKRIEIQDSINDMVENALKGMKLAKQSTVDQLKKKVTDLENRLGSEGSAG